MLASKVVNAFARGLGMAVSGDLHPSNPEVAKLLGLGGSQTSAGVRVDHENVMALPAIMRAVSIISSSVASVPFQVRRIEGETETPAIDHVSWNVITDNPSDGQEFTQEVFRETMTGWALIWGNAVAHITRPTNWPRSGNVYLTPLLPDRTRPVRISPRDIKRFDIDVAALGMLYYETEVDGTTLAFPATDCVHIRGLGPNAFWGYNIVDVLIETFGGAKASRDFGHRFFGQGANPAGFIEAPVGLSNEGIERMSQSIQRGLGGLGKAHRLMVLEEGSKFHQWSIDPQKAQFLEGKEFDIRELSMAIGIKIHKLIDSKGTSYNSLSESNKEHKDDDILPWLRRWKAEYNSKLLTKQQRRSGAYRVSFDDKFLEYVSFADKAKGTVELFNNGVITKEESRKECGYGPSQKPNGDRYRKPLNIGFEDEQMVARPIRTEQEPDQSLQREFIRREKKRLYKAAVETATRSSSKFCTWLDNLQQPSNTPHAIKDEIAELYEDTIAILNEIADNVTAPQLVATIKVTLSDYSGDRQCLETT